MIGILKVSEGSLLALKAVILLAKNSGEPMTTKEVSESLEASLAHLSKILQRLGKAGIVRAARGPNGGYVLVRALTELRVLDVLEAIEGPVKLDPCRIRVPGCENGGSGFSELFNTINAEVLQHFEKRLSELYKV